ncbi:MAG TPA: chemotaxis protein [Oscillatoriaceae cyanobacterium M33_DOE_052]|nr:chemotaxis protein [Oscillatoriaceae cyanobacterium M33_DOE_052]
MLLFIGSAYIVFRNSQTSLEKVEAVDATRDNERNIQIINVETRRAYESTIAYLLQKNDAFVQDYEAAKANYTEVVEVFQQNNTDDEQKVNLEELDNLLADIELFNEKIISLVNQGKEKEAIELWRRERAVERTRLIGNQIEKILARGDKIFRESQKIQNDSLISLSNTVWILTGLSLLVSIGMGWLLISGMVERMNREAQAIAAASVQIASTVEEQERVASQQASSVNETTTTMHELSASSRQSAQQAEAAAISARQIMVLASGVVAAEDHFNGKSSLKDQSKQIAAQVIGLTEQLRQIYSITTVVSEIANQTNMLAINAAVEGVRAGDAGKGFGVVAAEIRKLADQSRKSAEKIEDIIKHLEKAANSTVKVTEEGTQAVDEMVKSINDVALNIQQISYTAGQQATAISQVMEAMTHINNGARATASGIAQTKVSTENLNTTAQKLKELV